jgi:hypothetical protein
MSPVAEGARAKTIASTANMECCKTKGSASAKKGNIWRTISANLYFFLKITISTLIVQCDQRLS